VSEPGHLPLAVVQNELRVDSRALAERLGVTHKANMNLVRKHQAALEELGKLPFEKAPSAAGQMQTYCLLNEDQSVYLLTLSKNTRRVARLKLELTKAFMAYRNAFIVAQKRRATAEWLEARADGRLARRAETDVIQEFVGYARAQGSRHAERYYRNITRMTHRALFAVEKGLDLYHRASLREFLEARQLVALAAAENVAAKALQDGMDSGMPYRDIYLLAKDRVLALAELVGRTPVALPPAATTSNPQPRLC